MSEIDLKFMKMTGGDVNKLGHTWKKKKEQPKKTTTKKTKKK